jgi:hypothetical protein
MLVRSFSLGVSAAKFAINSSINACHRPIAVSLKRPQSKSFNNQSGSAMSALGQKQTSH